MSSDDMTDQQLIDRAVAALTEIENRMRLMSGRKGLRLPIIDAVLDFAKTLPETSK
jgi:hypothetical protein